jgi:hypothetical protein
MGDNIRMYLTEIEWEGVDCDHVARDKRQVAGTCQDDDNVRVT